MGTPKPPPPPPHTPPPPPPEWIAFAPLLLLIVALGIYPQLLFKMTDLPVTELVHGLSRALG